MAKKTSKSPENSKSKEKKGSVKKNIAKKESKSLGQKFTNKMNSISYDIKHRLKEFRDYVVSEEIVLEGQEPPKYYSFSKKFYGIYFLFVGYSFLLILAINDPNNLIIGILTFGYPFILGNTVFTFLFILSLLVNIDKFRIWLFEKHTIIKQIIVYAAIMVPFFILYLFLRTNINYISIFLSFAMIWLFLYSSRFYMLSRKFSTKIESKVIARYSYQRYFFALIAPWFVIVALVFISLFYRGFLVFLALDFFGPNNPTQAAEVYQFEMRVIMPLIYFSLIMTVIFIVFEYVFTRRRAETKRVGSFDNLTYALIVFFIFFYQIFQITIFLLLRPETIEALKATVGESSGTVTFIFIIEFAVSMFFLYRIVRKMGQTLGWKVLIFNKDGLILLSLTCVFAQSLTRFSLNRVPNQVLTGIGEVLLYDKFIVSIIMILFLGATLLIYYLKPHETSMFIRLQKETVDKEEEELDKIYKIIRTEYIRRGEKYPIEIVEKELIKATLVSKSHLYSLINDLARKDMDIVITQQRDENGEWVKYIDFISVTERFEKKQVAQAKAKSYLTQRLTRTLSKGDKKSLKLASDLDTEKASDQFIASLSNDYTKKQEAKALFQEKLSQTEISFKDGKVFGSVEETILSIIRDEYQYRIENVDKYEDTAFPISSIADYVERKLKVNPGELYQIIKELSKTDLELRLIPNPEEPEDKKIKLLCVSDDSLNRSLENFRPELYKEIQMLSQSKFDKAIHRKKAKNVLLNLQRGMANETDQQKSWRNIYTILIKQFADFEKELTGIPNKKKLQTLINNMIKAFEKKQEALKK